MAYEQDIIQLPVRFFDYTDLEGMAVAINRNFNEIERYLSILQGYVKQASGGAVSNLPSVLSGLAPNGIFDVSKLSDKMVGLEHELQIAAEAVTEAKIAVEAITSNKIATDAVTEQKIAASAVTALKIANGSLELAKFATGLRPVQIVNSLPPLPDPNYPQGATVFLTTNNVLYRSTGAEWTSIVDNVAPGAIGSDQLAANSVIAGKIAAGAVSADELAANSVVAGKVAANAIGADAIAAEAVTTDKLAALSVIAAKIAAGAITTEKILADAVTADKINVSQLSAISADMGTVNAGIINADVVIAGQYATTNADMLSRIPGLYYVTSTELLGSQIAAFKRNTVAYRQNGTQVATDIPRYEAGKYGQAFVAEEGTEPLLTQNQASVETDTTGFIANGATITRVTTEKYHGLASLRVVTNDVDPWEGFLTTKFAASDGVAYSAQGRVKGVSGTVILGLRAFDADGVYLGEKNTQITLNGTWQQVKVENYVTPTGTTQLDIAILTPTEQSITFYYDCGQVEQKAYCTSWTDIARVAEVLTVPTAGVFNKGNWTIEGVYIPQIPTNVGDMDKYLFHCYINADNEYKFAVGWGGEWHFKVRANGDNKIISGGSTVQGTPYFWSISGNGSVIRLCVNGVQIGSDLAYIEPVGDLPANMYIGCVDWGSSQANGLIDDFRVSNRARTLAEHQEVYNGGKPLEVDKDTTLLMPLDNTLRQKARNRLLHEVGTFTIASADTTNNPSRATHIVPAGWTSAQTTINQAISELPTNGGKIVLMEGTYIIDGSIILPSNVTLEISTGATVKLRNAFNADINLITNADHTNGNINIQVIGEGIINGNKVQQALGTQHGVYFEKVSSSYVKDLSIINARHYGIYLNVSSSNIIAGNVCKGNDNSGIYLNWSSKNNTVMGNICRENTKNGIYAHNSSKNTITGNVCKGNGTRGINLYDFATHNTITGNTCQENGYDGICLHYTSGANTIVGNTCVENSQAANNSYDNIHISDDCDRNNIQSNTCRMGSLTNKPRYGINIATSNCDDNLVTNNDLITSGVSGSFNNAGTNTQVNAGNRL